MFEILARGFATFGRVTGRSDWLDWKQMYHISKSVNERRWFVSWIGSMNRKEQNSKRKSLCIFSPTRTFGLLYFILF